MVRNRRGDHKPTLLWLHSHVLLSTGGTRFVHETLRELRTTHHVVLAVEKASPHWRAAFASLGVEVLEINRFSSMSWWYWAAFPLMLWHNWQRLQPYWRQADVVVSSIFPMHVFAAWHQRGIAYCFEPYAFFYDQALLGQLSLGKRLVCRMLAWCWSWLDVWALRHVRALLTFNESVGYWIERQYTRRVDGYTHLGVDSHHFRLGLPPLWPRRKGQFVILHSTDYTALKGTDMLLQAWPLVARALPQVRLKISESIADAAGRKRARRLLAGRAGARQVEFLGHLSYDELPRAYAGSDVYVFCGDPLSQGATAASLSVLEAQACGVRVVRTVGNRDEVPPWAGVLVDPRDPEALAQAIVTTLQRRVAKRRLHERIARSYSWRYAATIIRQQIAMFGQS